MSKPLFELLERIARKVVKKVGKKGAKHLDRFFFSDEKNNPATPVTYGESGEDYSTKMSSIFDNYISTNTNFIEGDKRIETDFNGLSFGDAFASARNEAGGGGHWFKYNDNWYNTFHKEEWDNLGVEGQQDFTKLFLEDLEEINLENISSFVDTDWGNLGDINNEISSEIEPEIVQIPESSEVTGITSTGESEGVVHTFLNWINDLLDFDD